MKNKSIAGRLILLISATSLIIFLFIFGFFYGFARLLIWHGTERYARSMVKGAANQMEAFLRPVQRVPEGLAASLESAPLDRDSLVRLLKSLADRNRDVYATWVAFEPYAFAPGAQYFAPYCFRQDGKLEVRWRGSDSHRYFYLDYYQIPKELGRPIWTEPYIDMSGGRILAASYCVPFYRTVGGQRRFAGIAGVDVSLDWLTRVIDSISALEPGYAFLLTKNGTFVTHPKKPLIMNETIFSVAELRRDPDLRQTGRRIIRGESGFVSCPDFVTGASSHMFFAPLPSAGWSLGFVITDWWMTGDMRRLSGVIVALSAGGLLLLLLVLSSACRNITAPLTTIIAAAAEVARGDLAAAEERVRQACRQVGSPLEDLARRSAQTRDGGAGRQDESKELIVAIGGMIQNLRSLIGEVQKTSTQLLTAATEISATAKQQETMLQGQGASTSEIAASVHEISATGKELAGTMERVTAVAAETARMAGAGRAGMKEMEEGIRLISAASGSVSKRLAVINEKAGNINTVMATITKVADQTNLLSLNAAIEAEKAGEHGLGFGVVSREIRRLADQTAVAAVDIERTIEGMQSAVASGVMEMDGLTGAMSRGLESVQEIGTQMGRIIAQVEELMPQFQTVRDGMQSQSQGAQQINEAMVQLASGARLTLESLREFILATEHMHRAMGGLKEEVQKFKVGGGSA